MSIELNGTTGIQFNDGSDQSTAATPYGRKNLIINGDMRIAQRGTSVSGITSGQACHSVDRFNNNVNIVGTWTVSQDTDVPSGQGFSNSFKMQCTTANASLSAASVLQFSQLMEGQNLQHLKYGTANAEKVTCSFWVKSNKTGTYVGRLYTPSPTKASHITFTIDSSDTWEKKTLTFNGDTSTTLVNSNAEGFRFTIWLAAGSNFTSGTQDGNNWVSYTGANSAVALTVNLADSTSNYINITGVQLEVGEGASDFEFLPYDVQLQRCERYFQKCGFWNGCGNSSTAWLGVVSAHTTMRTSPSVGQTGVLQLSDFYAIDATQSATSVAILNSNNTTLSICIWIFNFSGLVGGKYYGGIRAAGGIGNYITLSAEL